MGSERKIPRITHQIWFQGWDKLPAKFQANADALARLNPNYTHMKWDEQGLRAECLKVGPEVAAKFDSFPLMIQKIDFGRYVVLYNYGGISVDTDMAQLKPIDMTPHIDTEEFIVSNIPFPTSYITKNINNAIIIVSPHNIIMNDLIMSIVQQTQIKDKYLTDSLYVMHTTGPIFFYTVINKYKNIIKLDNKYFEPCFSSDPFCSVSAVSIMDHQHEQSWLPSYFNFIWKFLFILMYISFIVIPVGIVYGGYRLFTSRWFAKVIRKVRG
jgi:mannosyltransferase OCH1-like enzyme